MSWLQALMPKDDRFFELFAAIPEQTSLAPPTCARSSMELHAPGLWWCKHRDGRCGSRGRRLVAMLAVIKEGLRR
jgi:hypothetical protein